MQPEYDFLQPASLREALETITTRDKIAPIAGGTNLVVDMRGGRQLPAAVIHIGRLPELRGIRIADGFIHAGAAVTISELLHDPEVVRTSPALVQAGHVFANPLVRNRATLAGNLADGSPAADTAPPLLALDARLTLSSSRGTRTIPLHEFFLGVRRTALQPGELICEIAWPVPPARSTSIFYKLGLRKADAISVASAAVYLELGPDGLCRQARIALGSVAPTARRASDAENYLVGKAIDAETAAEAGRLAATAASPISDVRASAAYRLKMTAVLTRRLVLQAAAAILKEN